MTNLSVYHSRNVPNDTGMCLGHWFGFSEILPKWIGVFPKNFFLIFKWPERWELEELSYRSSRKNHQKKKSKFFKMTNLSVYHSRDVPNDTGKCLGHWLEFSQILPEWIWIFAKNFFWTFKWPERWEFEKLSFWGSRKSHQKKNRNFSKWKICPSIILEKFQMIRECVWVIDWGFPRYYQYEF